MMLQPGLSDPGVMAWVTGWGLTRVTPTKIIPAILQKVQLPIVSNAQAALVWGSIPVTDIMAGYLTGIKMRAVVIVAALWQLLFWMSSN